MKPSIRDRMAALRDDMEAGVRIEKREVHGHVVDVKVYPDSRGSGHLEGDITWGSLRKKGSIKMRKKS